MYLGPTLAAARDGRCWKVDNLLEDEQQGLPKECNSGDPYRIPMYLECRLRPARLGMNSRDYIRNPQLGSYYMYLRPARLRPQVRVELYQRSIDGSKTLRFELAERRRIAQIEHLITAGMSLSDCM